MGTSIHLGESCLPQKSLSAFFLPEAFCNFTQSSFSFCHTIILYTCQYASIHHVVMGFGCVTSHSPTGPRAPRRQVLLIMVPGIQHAWCRVECIVDTEWRCGISMGWIRKLGGHWCWWLCQKKYSLGTVYHWGFTLRPTPKCFTDRAGMMESYPPCTLLWLACLGPVEECHLLVLTDLSSVQFL